MTHSRAAFGVALALIFCSGGSVFGSELDESHEALAQANDDYYAAIRNKTLSPAAAAQLNQQLVGPAVERNHRAFEKGLESSIAQYGLKPGVVKESGEKPGSYAHNGKHWVRPADFDKPFGTQQNSSQARQMSLEPSDTPAIVKEIDHTPIKYDNSNVKVVKYPGAPASQKIQSNAVRSPAMDPSQSSK